MRLKMKREKQGAYSNRSNQIQTQFEPISNPNYKYTLAPMQLVTPSVVAIAVAIDTMS